MNRPADLPDPPRHGPNVDELAFLPVIAGFWRQHELWDGTYTLDDFLDALWIMRTPNTNF